MLRMGRTSPPAAGSAGAPPDAHQREKADALDKPGRKRIEASQEHDEREAIGHAAAKEAS